MKLAPCRHYAVMQTREQLLQLRTMQVQYRPSNGKRVLYADLFCALYLCSGLALLHYLLIHM